MKSKSAIKIVVLLTLLIGISGCGPMSPIDYVQKYEKNRKKSAVTIQRNGVIAKVAYIPTEYYAARDMVNSKDLILSDAMKKYKESLYFLLQLKRENENRQSMLLFKNGVSGFKENVLRNTFGKGKDIFLLNAEDTVKVANYFYDRNWGVTTGDCFVLVFPKKKMEKDQKKYHLILRDFMPEIGTIDIPLASLIKNNNRLKG